MEMRAFRHSLNLCPILKSFLLTQSAIMPTKMVKNVFLASLLQKLTWEKCGSSRVVQSLSTTVVSLTWNTYTDYDLTTWRRQVISSDKCFGCLPAVKTRLEKEWVESSIIISLDDFTSPNHGKWLQRILLDNLPLPSECFCSQPAKTLLKKVCIKSSGTFWLDELPSPSRANLLQRLRLAKLVSPRHVKWWEMLLLPTCCKDVLGKCVHYGLTT